MGVRSGSAIFLDRGPQLSSRQGRAMDTRTCQVDLVPAAGECGRESIGESLEFGVIATASRQIEHEKCGKTHKLRVNGVVAQSRIKTNTTGLERGVRLGESR
jgi:hypothetical protein